MSKVDGKAIEICGQQFRIVKNGLDEAEVLSFISGLNDQNKQLTDKLDNLDPLMQFAERMVAEAGSLAEGIKTEGDKRADEKTASIIAEAEDEAKGDAERIIGEAKERAEVEKQRIHEEAKHLGIAARKTIEREIREKFGRVCEEVFSESDYTERSVAISTEDESETPLELEFQAAPVDEAAAFTAETEDLLASAREEESKESEDDQDRHEETPADELQDQLPSAEQEEGQEEGHTLYQGAVELRIPPPVSLQGLMRIHRKLKKYPEIEVMDAKGSVEEGTNIDLHLHTGVPLIQILESFDEVKKALDLGENNDRLSGHLMADKQPVRTIELAVKQVN